MVSSKKIVGIEFSSRDHQDCGEAAVKKLLNDLKVYLDEVFVLCTCERIFICAYTDDFDQLRLAVSKVNLNNPRNQFKETESTVNHLFEISSGLNSKILGEYEILGQINKYFAIARLEDCIGPHLDELIRASIKTGKEVRVSTNISRRNISYASLSLKLVYHEFGQLNLNYLVIGTGTLANNVLRILSKYNLGNLYIASHDLSRARNFTQKHGGTPVLIENLDSISEKIDVIIGGTHGNVNLSKILETKGKCPRHTNSSNPLPKLIIDFGSPANFPIRENYTGTYIGLDDLREKVEINMMSRMLETAPAKTLINEAVNKFCELHQQRKISGVLGRYWNSLNDSQKHELEWLLPKLDGLSRRDIHLIEKFSHRLIRRVAKQPLLEIRKLAQDLDQNSEKIATINNVLNSN